MNLFWQTAFSPVGDQLSLSYLDFTWSHYYFGQFVALRTVVDFWPTIGLNLAVIILPTAVQVRSCLFVFSGVATIVIDAIVVESIHL